MKYIERLSLWLWGSMFLPWFGLLIIGGCVGLEAYAYADKGRLLNLCALIFEFGLYVWCGIMLIKRRRLKIEIKKIRKDIKILKEGIDFYTSLAACENNEGEEWKNKSN